MILFFLGRQYSEVSLASNIKAIDFMIVSQSGGQWLYVYSEANGRFLFLIKGNIINE